NGRAARPGSSGTRRRPRSPRPERPGWLRSEGGEGGGLAAGGASEGPRRLGRILSQLRRRAPLVRGVRGGSARDLPPVRRRAAPSLQVLRRAVLFDRGRRLRGVRRARAARRAVRLEDPPREALEDLVFAETGYDGAVHDLREADHGHGVVGADLAVV